MKILNKTIFAGGGVILALILSECAGVHSENSGPLSPDEIIKMCSSGISEQDVIFQIRSRGIGFEFNLPVMQRFVEKGVSTGILQVIMGLADHNSSRRKRMRGMTGKSVAAVDLVREPQ